MSAPEVAPVRSTNVRRSIVTMLTTLVGLSTPLAAQNAVTAGLAYTVGSGWQVEGFDVGLARAVHAGPIAALRSEEHTLNSSHGSISYAVFCLKKKQERQPSRC